MAISKFDRMLTCNVIIETKSNPTPDGGAAMWQPALLQKGRPTNLIILDQQDNTSIPTPQSDTCIKKADMPTAKPHPYQVVRRGSLDERYLNFPTRASSLKRGSASRSPTPSPTRSDIDPHSGSTSAMRNFRDIVWSKTKNISLGCAITGEGLVNGNPMPALEAAYIVPQSQWYTYPMDDEGTLADPAVEAELQQAYNNIWGPDNGVLLMASEHNLFDTLFFSIHPETRRIRAFVNTGCVTKYHGKTYPQFDDLALKLVRHHYIRSVFENTIHPSIPTPDGPLTGTPILPPAKYLRLGGDPVKQPSNLATSSLPGIPPLNTAGSDSRGASPHTTQAVVRPPSPPLSEHSSEAGFEKGIVEVAEGFGRGRPSEKKRLTSTMGEEEQWMGRQTKSATTMGEQTKSATTMGEDEQWMGRQTKKPKLE
ncbi:hypothetical protein VM1G_06791 [Cytospora mali]|uniref:HNH nuclease domain-containing protein n=1 Tax=Cytospora mali TaxID=578113 RepID=A0A194W488_CYTMA|nr:hypothetical protein VM1G_06791 [Valsa mali]